MPVPEVVKAASVVGFAPFGLKRLLLLCYASIKSLKRQTDASGLGSGGPPRGAARLLQTDRKVRQLLLHTAGKHHSLPVRTRRQVRWIIGRDAHTWASPLSSQR